MYLREVVQKSYQGSRSSAELREERSYGSGQRTDERKEGVEKERLKGGDSEANARPSGWGVGVELGVVLLANPRHLAKWHVPPLANGWQMARISGGPGKCWRVAGRLLGPR